MAEITSNGSDRAVPDHLLIVSGDEMGRIEKDSDAAGHSYASMMKLAGESVANAIAEEFPYADDTPILVLAGPGNNGGDGLVCARHLSQMDYQVRVFLWKRRTDPEHDYENHFASLVNLGVESARLDDNGLDTLGDWLAESEVVVDALLGTGVNRPIEGDLAELLDHVTQAREERSQEGDLLTVVAVDTPSGINCNTGEADPHTVPADITVTFGYAKVGHFRFPAADLIGQLVVADIAIDPEIAGDIQTFALSSDYVVDLLPERPIRSHKGTFGKAMAVVGSVNYPGAAHLCCAAMGRVGAGLVTGAIPQPVWMPVATALAEPTWLLLSHEMGVINENAVSTINAELADYDAVLLGCGLTREDATRDFIQKFLTRTKSDRPSTLPSSFAASGDEPVSSSAAQRNPAVNEPTDEDDNLNEIVSTPFGAIRRRNRPPAEIPPLPPILIDADGLNLLARLDNWTALLPSSAILTPHPAEMARLCGLDTEDVLEQPWELARSKATEWNVVVLLKGPYTVVARPDGRLAVLPVATAALATAGTGDILAGAITGLLAQGLTPFDAACLGAWLHGRAGEMADSDIGPAGAVAGDLLAYLPMAMNELRQW